MVQLKTVYLEMILKTQENERISKIVDSYFKAKRFVLENGYKYEIEWQENISFNSINEENFLVEVAWVILSTGMREQVIRSIFPNFVDAMFPLAGTLICFYLLFQPKLATIADIASSILGLFYGGYLPSYWIRLRVNLDPQIFDPHLVASKIPVVVSYAQNSWINFSSLSMGLIVTLLGFGCIWAADIGAYFVGKFFGRISLSQISPKKTLEGAVFGVVASMAVGPATPLPSSKRS